jgi:hypothetical protein
MSTLRRLLDRLGTVGTLLGAGVFLVPGSPRKTASDPDEELRAAFEAWARSSSGEPGPKICHPTHAPLPSVFYSSSPSPRAGERSPGAGRRRETDGSD